MAKNTEFKIKFKIKSQKILDYFLWFISEDLVL